MALINCPECGKEISDTSENCIHCGYVVHPEKKQQSKRKRLILVWSVIIALALVAVVGVLWVQSRESSAFNNSKTAYMKLNDATSICNKAMSDIYNAWMWGIYDYDDSKTGAENAKSLQKEVSIDLRDESGEYSVAGGMLTLSSLLYDNDWQGCVELVISSYKDTGLYQEVQTLMDEAQQALKAVSEGNADYQYYPMLKQYYAKVNAMFEFVQSPTGSFEQLKTTKNSYSNDILNFQGDLSFVFAE